MLDGDPNNSSTEPLTPQVEDRNSTLVAGEFPSRRRAWAMTLGVGLLAGAAAWLVGEAALTAFKPEMENFRTYGGGIRVQPSPAGEIKASIQNSALAFGILGAILGLSLGFVGGLLRGVPRRGAMAGLAGLILAGGLGACTSLALVPIYHRFRVENPLSDDLTIPLLVHAGIWATVGIAGGLAYGIGMTDDKRRIVRAGLGGLVGGLVASATFELIGGAVFPFADTPSPLALSWSPRLFARLLVTTLAAAGAVGLIFSEPDRKTVVKG